MAKRHKFGNRGQVDFTLPRSGNKKQRHSGFGRQAAKSAAKKSRSGGYGGGS